MIFCKCVITSIRVVCSCIQTFSKTSGLKAKFNKSFVYTTGVQLEIKEIIRSITQFTSSSLPFKYLGVTLTSKWLAVADCEQLADGMLTELKVGNQIIYPFNS